MKVLACARIGAVHSVIFAGFSADAIADRIDDAKSKWVVTASAGSRGGRNLPLKTICDVAIKKERCVGVVQKVFVFDGAGSNGSDWEEEDIHVRLVSWFMHRGLFALASGWMRKIRCLFCTLLGLLVVQKVSQWCSVVLAVKT